MLLEAEKPWRVSGRPAMVLSVLGGSSPATPVLLQALRAAQRRGLIGALQVRLYGRNEIRLRRIREYARTTSACGRASTSVEGVPALSVTTHTNVGRAVRGATHILCMIRAGGMAGRARDEALALAGGVPADEGIAAGGLSCFLRTRQAITTLAEHCARHAPQAFFIQMASPLGLNVALSRAAFGPRSFGLCELPRTTAQSLARELGSHAGLQWVDHSHAGLNHQSWLYAFRDTRDRDITDDVLDALPAAALFGIEAGKIRELGAVPVPYLRLYVHTQRVLRGQRGAPLRGRVLESWSRRVHRALCSGASVDVAKVSRLLAQRTMDWFDDGVVPVLAAFGEVQPRRCVLNVPAGDAFPGVAADAIVEIDCHVSAGGVTPLKVGRLPVRPEALTRQLIAYESAVLGLPTKPSTQQLAAVLEGHPLVPRRSIRKLATALAGMPADNG
jgi:6-phospho-beta-glucosidase